MPSGRRRVSARSRRAVWSKLVLLALAAVSSVLGAVVGASADPRVNAAPPRPPVAKLLGQRIMVGLPGPEADRPLLDRVRAGEVGSVILFARNIVSRRQVSALTGSLQRAAREGHNPPLLIAVDQEGGEVRRFAYGPPDLSPPQIARAGGPALAEREGEATGGYLRGLGVNWNLAPVADVPAGAQDFIWREGRAFSFSGATVARYATAFAQGLQRRGVLAAAKHFPGLGTALTDTDFAREELRPSPAQFENGLRPYRSLIAAGVASIMLSTAGFPFLDASGASAALSGPVIQGLLRGRLRFTGLTITDALETPTGHDPVRAGVLAAQAGADVLLYTGDGRGVLAALERALRTGSIGSSAALAAYQRIVAAKARVAAG